LKNLESATFGWLSRDLWFGQRTPLVPFVMKLVGATPEDVSPYIAAQIVLGAIAWSMLAFTVGRRLPGGWRWVATVTVLLLGLTTPVTMWDHVILTESLSVTFLVLTVTTGILVVERADWPRVAALSGALFGLVAVRDTHIVLSGLLFGVVAAALGWQAWKRREVVGPLVVVAVVLLALTAFGRSSTVQGERYINAIRETLFVKLLPYEDRFEWLADRGMPDAERLRELRSSIYPDPQTGTPLFPLPAYGDPEWQEFNDWVRDDASALYNRWLLQHPVEAVGDYFRRPKMIWNSAGDSWVFYRHPEYRTVPLVTNVLYPPLLLFSVLGAAATAWLAASRPRWWRDPIAVVGLLLVGTGLVHGLASYLGDPAEVARHALVSNIQIRLGLVLMILLALPEIQATSRSRATRLNDSGGTPSS
jgi:hypothetical protein